MAFPTTSRDVYTQESPYEAENGSFWYWDNPIWKPITTPATLADISDAGTAAAADLIDEDNMASDSAEAVPTQQSVKAYVDNNTPMVDNTAVNAAIADDPVATQSALGMGSAATQATAYLTIAGAGVDSTGATDSTAAIHAIISEAQTNGPNAVFFPRGIYKCNLSITGNLMILGSGSGDAGDWVGSSASEKTWLVPNSNASPVINITASDNVTLKRFEIVGNGAGTSTEGLRINNPGGYLLEDVNIRRFTKNLRSLAGCNFNATHCGFFQGNTNISIEDGVLAHSYVFRLCSIGGAPATGDGRCFDVTGGAFLTIINCEQGNCTDYLKVNSGSARFLILQSNWETFSGSLIMDTNTAQMTLIGGRMAVDNKVILKVNSNSGYIPIFIQGLSGGTGNTLIEHNGRLYANVTGVGGQSLKEYSSDWGTLIGTSDPRTIRAHGRLTAQQTIGASGTHTVIFNSVDSGGYYNSTTGIFKPQRRGYYLVNASLRLSTVPGGYAALRFLKNDVEHSNPVFVTSGGAGTTICGNDLVALDANDELKIALVCGGACDIQVGSNYSTKFSIIEMPSEMEI